MTHTAASALILGDSQAEQAGAVFEAALRASGYAVTRSAHHGYSGTKLAAIAPDGPFDLVLLMVGGNDSPGASTGYVGALLDQYQGAQVYVLGPPPATRIADLARARTVFGSKVDGADYWFTSGTASDREQRNAELQAAAQDRAVFLDWRALGGTVQPSGVAFPDQPDGIHVSKATAQAWLDGPGAVLTGKQVDGSSAVPLFLALGLGFLLFRRLP